MDVPYFDVVIVGAGLSGIGAACHLREKCPQKSFVILESRDALGGTWDKFRYPGIRSDSDMFTLGFGFKPWKSAKAIADGPAILEYLRETVTENNLESDIRFDHKVVNAEWDKAGNTWEVETENSKGAGLTRFRGRFLLICAGYYRYDRGYLPEFEGSEAFAGTLVHPQDWPEDLDYRNKKVVVVGSGATAVTLVPELAKEARSVVMLQRSPTYMAARPDEDMIVNWMRKFLPERMVYAIARWKNIRFQQYIYRKTRDNPKKVRGYLLKLARKELGPDCDFETNFVPRYNPWDQRLCLVPNADFFHAVRDGKAEVVTDKIDRFTESGIRLASGRELEADIIVTATGLALCVMGDIRFIVDGEPVVASDRWSYKSMMLSGVPNLIATFGYINASWTLKADLTADYTCRLINHMDATGSVMCVPELRATDKNMPALDWISDFSSGYMQRSMHLLPKQGDRPPWINTQNYYDDIKLIQESEIEDGVLKFIPENTDANVEKGAPSPAMAG